MITPWGSLITFEVSSAAPDAEPVWVDLSDRVIVPNGSTLETWLGRATELDNDDPGRAQFILRNRDDALTPGNTSSIYYPWWKQSRRFRIREIIGYLGFDLADGYLEIPENTVQMQDPDATDSDVVLRVSGVDVMGRYQSSRAFVSTLGEHIIANGRTALRYYFPLGETASPATAFTGTATLTELIGVHASGYNATAPALPSLTWGGGDPAPGNDLNCVHFQPSRDVTGTPVFVSSYRLEGSVAVTLSAGQVITMVVWVRCAEIFAGGTSNIITLSGIMEALISYDVNGQIAGVAGQPGDWDGGLTASETGGTNRMFPVALRFGFSPAVIELWVGSNVYIDTMAVTNAVSGVGNTLKLGRVFSGDISDVQIYVGAESDWTRNDFLAQYEVGLQGLDRQTTGERIHTILDYAGFPAGRRDIGPGVSVMQRAQLAGRTVQSVLAEATDTERGRLIAVGGRAVFHDRRRIYDV